MMPTRVRPGGPATRRLAEAFAEGLVISRVEVLVAHHQHLVFPERRTQRLEAVVVELVEPHVVHFGPDAAREWCRS